jgi:hypothetical protein
MALDKAKSRRMCVVIDHSDIDKMRAVIGNRRISYSQFIRDSINFYSDNLDKKDKKKVG